MRKQFDSCSYGELTSCVHYRIKTIREFRQFLNDEKVHSYPSVRVAIGMKILIMENEIKRLLRMR
jgi:hypothetical protein